MTTVSAIIPAHNSALTIARALESVLAQTRPPDEIIVVDDASSDATCDIAADYADRNVRLVRLTSQHGAGGARNKGIEAAAGDLVAFLDADDEWLSCKLKKQVSLLESDPRISIVGCGITFVSPEGSDLGDLFRCGCVVTGQNAWKALLACNFIATSTVVTRRRQLLEIGGFDARLKIAEDQDLFIRLALLGSLGHVQEKLARKHEHDDSLSSWNLGEILVYTLPMVERHIAALGNRLSAAEIRRIRGERINRCGRVAYAQGDLVNGVALTGHSILLGYKPFGSLGYLIAASPPATWVKQWLRFARTKPKGDREQNAGRILLISSNFPPLIRGSSAVYDQICRKATGNVIALSDRRDHETGHFLSGVDEHDATCGYEIHRIEQLRSPQAFKHTRGLRRWVGLVFADLPLMSRVVVAVARLLIRNRIQTVCIGELVSLGWLVVPLRHLFGRRVIIYMHGEEIAHASGGFAARLRRFYLSRANGVVSVSLFCKSLIVSRFEIDPARIAVIANGVDLTEFGRRAPDQSLPVAMVRSRKIVLAVCRLVERKGLDRLIAAMPKVLAVVPDVRCVIAGEGPLAGELAEQISREGLSDHVTLTGKVPSAELAKLYRTADLFALPCRTLPDGDTEGFGLVFLEAGACGKPVVAGAAGGTIEAVIDGETGLVVNGDDPAEIADAIIRVLTDAPLAARLGEAGRRRAQEFGWPKATAAFLNFALDQRPQQIAIPSYPDAGEGVVALPAPARLLVTVDVEEGFDWSKFSRKDYVVEGLRQLEAFQNGCQSLGVSPVYLQTWSVLGDRDFRAWFRSLLANGSAEAGTHLHGWTTPPFWEEANVFNSYQCNLPESMERRKLEMLTRRFSEALGVSPLIHRAGRWGGSARTARLLKELGYRIDLSPSARYCDNRGVGPDFRNIDGGPFWCDADREVLVVPASSLKFGRGPEWISTLRRGIRGRDAEVADIEGTAVRFSSEGRSLSQVKSMARQFSRRGDPVLVLSLHSSSLVAGGNPYSRSRASAAANLERTRALLAWCIDVLGMRPTSCAALFEEARAADRDSVPDRRPGVSALRSGAEDAAATPA